MAIDTTTMTDLGTAITAVLQPDLTKIWSEQTVLLNGINVVPGGSGGVYWDVQIPRATMPGAITDGADVADAEYVTDATVRASLDWGLYRTAFSISGPALSAAMSATGSPEMIRALFRDHLTNAMSALARKLNLDAFSGLGTSSALAGLDVALLASGTYANLAIGTYSTWASNVLANGGTARALEIDLIDQAEAAVYEDSGMPPSFLVASPAVVRKYGNKLQEVMATSPRVGEGSPAGALSANPGFTGLTYKGIPVIRDRNATSGKLYLISSGHVDLVAMRPVIPEGERAVIMTLGNGLPVKLEALAKTGDSYKFSLVTYCQLRVRNPSAHAVIADIAV